MVWLGESGRAKRYARYLLVGFGVGNAILAGRPGLAQIPASWGSPENRRLTVRPHEMATGTRTAQAGVHAVDSIPDFWVYVPQLCVGTRRCPLVVSLPGGGVLSTELLAFHRGMADRYGMLLLTTQERDQAERDIDAALKQVLRKYAIDSDKIALEGFSNGGSSALWLGRGNLDVFSRIAPQSPGWFSGEDGPLNPATQFFVAGGLSEAGSPFFQYPIRAAQELRRAGHRVKQVVGLRGHTTTEEERALLWQWLQESWGMPGPAGPVPPPPAPAPRLAADALPLLTNQALVQWLTFLQKTGGRFPERSAVDLLKEVTIPVGQERLSALIRDIPALAARDTVVAGVLAEIGLTAQQAEAYWIALISAKATSGAGVLGVGSVAATSVLGRNVEFLDTHRDELVSWSEMWNTP